MRFHPLVEQPLRRPRRPTAVEVQPDACGGFRQPASAGPSALQRSSLIDLRLAWWPPVASVMIACFADAHILDCLQNLQVLREKCEPMTREAWLALAIIGGLLLFGLSVYLTLMSFFDCLLC